MTDNVGQESEKLRFSWQELPAITAGLPGTGGETRVEIEDFAVTEVPSYLPSGCGPHAYALVEKRGLTTRDLVSALRREGVPERDVGVAGLKDKYAVTRQWLSVPDEFAAHLKALDGLDGVRVLEISSHKNKLRMGHLQGNSFEVRVRHPVADWLPHAEAVIARLKSFGLPSYFGPQRFGRFNSNAIDGLRLLRGETVTGDRRMRRYLLNALQSQLFNRLLKRRIELGAFAHVLSGDMAQKHDTGGVFRVEEVDKESVRAERLEISATLPLYGKNVQVSDGDAGKLDRETLEYFAISAEDFDLIPGSRRISRVRLDDVLLEAADDGYIVRFTLPKGAFATCLLRELTKAEDNI